MMRPLRTMLTGRVGVALRWTRESVRSPQCRDCLMVAAHCWLPWNLGVRSVIFNIHRSSGRWVGVNLSTPGRISMKCMWQFIASCNVYNLVSVSVEYFALRIKLSGERREKLNFRITVRSCSEIWYQISVHASIDLCLLTLLHHHSLSNVKWGTVN